MGAACQNCFGESPVQVNDDLASGAKASALNKQRQLAKDTASGSDLDGYASGAIMSTHSSLGQTDKNYSSKEICIDDFQIIKVIGRGSFGKVYLVQKKDDKNTYAMKSLKKDMVLRKGQTTNTRGKQLLTQATQK